MTVRRCRQAPKRAWPRAQKRALAKSAKNALEAAETVPNVGRIGMARLILSVDGVVIKEFTIAKERTTIGRKAHNDVQIEDTFLSGEHAAITQIGADCILEDL